MASVSLGQIDLMGPKRAEAVSSANAWFNERARENLHDDLVALAAGKSDVIASREQHKQKVLAKIAAITSPNELQAFMKDISKV